MCGAYGFSVNNAREVYDRFAIVNMLEGLKSCWNIRPGQMNPVITSHSPNRISRMFWGLIPHFAVDENYKYKSINAKAETVSRLASFREPFRHKRCIVPATGFYEPDKIHYAKPPFPWHYFQLKDQLLVGFAGIYDIWKDHRTGNKIYSYAIITTTPNSLVGKIHDRMPVILQKEDEETWLNPDITEPEHLLPLLQPYPADQMEEWQVGDAARNARNDSPELIKPLRSNTML
jgi:putative SOS response-associated peptidase YedK